MTYEFIIVFSVAITLKLMFMSFSLYVTYKQKKEDQAQVPLCFTTNLTTYISFEVNLESICS